MLTVDEILSNLDDSNNQSYYSSFIWLGDVYSYLIDCRLNVFRDENGRWAIAGERLGFNPRAGAVVLDIRYFGNCLMNLEEFNGQKTNNYRVFPVDWNVYNETIDGDELKNDAVHWIVRGVEIALSHKKQHYLVEGIHLKENEPNKISAQEAGRLLVTTHRQIFRATNEELYKCIPSHLEKVLVLDQWHHRDFVKVGHQEVTDGNLRYVYELYKNELGEGGIMDFDSFAAMFRQQEQRHEEYNQQQWQENRPSSYETWQQIAKVIVTGDTSLYKPTLQPNTHWKNWPESGSL